MISKSDRAYLDWNATTPLRPEARSAMMAAFDVIGNPSSVHAGGREARGVIEGARTIVAAATGAEARNVVFTAGGTEANAIALSPGLRHGPERPVEHLVVSAIEHSSVLEGGRFAPAAISIAPVTSEGVVDLVALRDLLAALPPSLVSVMLANNETGAIQPIAKVAELVREFGGVLHVDAVQAFGKIPLNIKELHCDLLTISAHKLGGPKGVGALVLGDKIEGVEALVKGGGQERGRRAGTENVIGIAGFGAAAEAAMRDLANFAARTVDLRNRLESGLKEVPGVVVFSETLPRLPNTTMFAAPGLRAETAVIAFDLEGVAVSSGSACSSGKVKASRVLTAMGAPEELARAGVRLSLGWETEAKHIDLCLKAFKKLAKSLSRSDDRALG